LFKLSKTLLIFIFGQLVAKGLFVENGQFSLKGNFLKKPKTISNELFSKEFFSFQTTNTKKIRNSGKK